MSIQQVCALMRGGGGSGGGRGGGGCFYSNNVGDSGGSNNGGGFYSSRVADRQAKSSAWPSWRDGTGKYQYVHVEYQGEYVGATTLPADQPAT